MRILFAMLVAAATLAAGDLTGKWSGSFNFTRPDGEKRDDQAYMVLKQEGETVTGTVGPNVDRQWPLKNGKLQGQKLTFEVQPEGDGPLVKFDLTFEGERIHGEAKAQSNEGQLQAKLDLKRVP